MGSRYILLLEEKVVLSPQSLSICSPEPEDNFWDPSVPVKKRKSNPALKDCRGTPIFSSPQPLTKAALGRLHSSCPSSNSWT